MDSRPNTVSKEGFFDILNDCFKNNKRVDLIIDNSGHERAGGKIISIQKDLNILNTRVKLDNSKDFILSQVVAVNGIFHDDYREC